MIAISIDSTQAMSIVGPLAERMADMTELYRKLLITALDQAGANIDSQGAFAGLTWAPMAEFTQTKPASMGGPRDPGTLLDETGVLRHITQFGSTNGQTFEVGPTGGSAGIFRPTPRGPQNVAKMQQEGTKKIPPRPFFGWFEIQLTEYERQLALFFEAGIGEGIEG